MPRHGGRRQVRCPAGHARSAHPEDSRARSSARVRHRSTHQPGIPRAAQSAAGSLYPALHRLEDRGWLAASWIDTDTGRRAKTYRLTKKGEAQLEREIADWRRLSQAIGWILQT